MSSGLNCMGRCGMQRLTLLCTCLPGLVQKLDDGFHVVLVECGEETNSVKTVKVPDIGKVPAPKQDWGLLRARVAYTCCQRRLFFGVDRLPYVCPDLGSDRHPVCVSCCLTDS